MVGRLFSGPSKPYPIIVKKVQQRRCLDGNTNSGSFRNENGVFLTAALKSFGTNHYRAQLKSTLQAARGLLPHCIYRLLYPFAISSICDQKITFS